MKTILSRLLLVALAMVWFPSASSNIKGGISNQEKHILGRIANQEKHLGNKHIFGGIANQEKHHGNKDMFKYMAHDQKYRYGKMEPIDKFIIKSIVRQEQRPHLGLLASRLLKLKYYIHRLRFEEKHQYTKLPKKEKKIFRHIIRDILMAESYDSLPQKQKTKFTQVERSRGGGELHKEKLLLHFMTARQKKRYGNLKPMDKFFFRSLLQEKLMPGHGIFKHHRNKLPHKHRVLRHMTPIERATYKKMSMKKKQIFRRLLTDVLMANTILKEIKEKKQL